MLYACVEGEGMENWQGASGKQKKKGENSRKG